MASIARNAEALLANCLQCLNGRAIGEPPAGNLHSLRAIKRKIIQCYRTVHAHFHNVCRSLKILESATASLEQKGKGNVLIVDY